MGFSDIFKKRRGGASGPSDTHDGLHVVHDPGSSAVADIIFIHGITGHPFRSWAKDPKQRPWIETLLPARIPAARVLTFGYHADISGVGSGVAQLSLRNHAENLVYDISQDERRKADRARPLLFVCHSMGGLLLQKALLLAKDDPDEQRKAMFQCTHGVAFFGTPMRGSDLKGLANFLRALFHIAGDSNKKLLSVLDKSSEELRDIQMSFRKLLRIARPSGLQNLNIVCFYESITMYPLGLIVEESSATLEDYPQRAIPANHVGMVQFGSPGDPGFRALTSELDSWVSALSSRVGPVGLSPDGWYQSANKRYEKFRTSGAGSGQLEEAMFLFKEAARLSGLAEPRDSVTYARSHLGIARCRRELTFKAPLSYAERRDHLDQARTHLHRAYDEAIKMNSDALKLRVELELAVVGARRVQVAEKESNLDLAAMAAERAEAVAELERLVDMCAGAGRDDLQEYAVKWLVKLGGQRPRPPRYTKDVHEMEEVQEAHELDSP